MKQQDKEDWGIAEAAALWAIRMRGPDAERDRAEFEQWCAQSERHQVEFLLARATDFQFDALKNTSPSVRRILAAPQQGALANVIVLRQAERKAPNAASDPSLFRSGGTPATRRPVIRWVAVAASLAIIAWGISGNLGSFASGQEYRTEIGERRTLRLEDGSLVTLNTASRIAVRFTADERAIDLIDGEALFEVAQDRMRPFRVFSVNTVVEDVSTRFTVQRRPESTKVTVTDGRVRILRTTTEGKVGVATSGFPVVELTVGNEATIVEEARRPVVVTRALLPEELESVLSWTDGYVEFAGGTALSEAVEQFNRYNERKIQIDDPQIAQFRVGGRFKANEPQAFVNALSTALPVDVVQPPRTAPPDQPIRLTGR